MAKSVARAVIEWVIGLLIFLILLVVANILRAYINNPTYDATLDLVNKSTAILIVMGILFMIGEVFMALMFPLNLPGPIFNAAGSVLLVGFLVKLLLFVNTLLETNVFGFLENLSAAIYALIFILVLLVGYIQIFYKIASGMDKRQRAKMEERREARKEWDERREEDREERKEQKEKEKKIKRKRK